jgi:hypothetical protein
MMRVARMRASTLFVLMVSAAPLFAQAPPRDGKLLVTVVDQTRAVIPGADVTVTGLEDATKAVTVDPVKTSDQGIATLTLRPGRYLITAEFPGFEPGLLKDVRIRGGDNRQTIVLAIQGFQDSVTVGRDKQEAAADRNNGSFGTALTREQVDALSDDPDEMAQQLQDMAGGNGVIRIDSFEGGQLPPKAMIKSIHVTRDAFAAENHSAGGLFIDIITQPGLGPLRGGGRYNLRDGSIDGRSPFTDVKGPERLQQYGTNFAGTLIKDRASFNLSLNGATSFDTPNLFVVTPAGTQSEALLSVRQPRTQSNVYAVLDYAITKDQTLRLNYNQNDNTQQNLGVGGYDQPDRAYSTEDHSHTLRIQEVGPLGRRAFTNTRLEIGWGDSSSKSAFDTVTIRVNDAFNSGGAQVAGGRQTRTFNLSSDLDYVRAIHSVRAGIVLAGGSYHSNDTANYLGTYTFTSLQAFEAGLPASYTRRIGDPNIDYFNLQAGAYIQDDIRVRKGLTISPGLRYEAQTHLSDVNALGPRIGVTWAPFKSGKTTLRASAGVFTDWLGSSTYEQTLRVDGLRQQELNIANPSYPDPGSVGVVPPINKYLLAGDLQMARNTRLSTGVDYALNPFSRFGVTYAHISGTGIMRGLNLNAPVTGIRPDPSVGNLIEVVGDAASRQDTLTFFSQISLTPPTMGIPKERWNWKRTNFFVNYILGRPENDSDGAFAVPATGSLASEWGPAANDVRHRFTAAIGTNWFRNLNASLNYSVISGVPYTIRTGLDDNGDQIFNDRPAGVGRNSVRGAATITLSGFFVYNIPIGQKKLGAMPPGIFITGAPGSFNVQTLQADALPRFRMGIVVNAYNLTNRSNYVGYSGTLSSPLFGQPTAVQGMRRIDIGLNFNF